MQGSWATYPFDVFLLVTGIIPSLSNVHICIDKNIYENSAVFNSEKKMLILLKNALGKL